MLLRWLFILLIIYALYRLFFKPNNTGPNSRSQRRRKRNFDHIEEAEYEDITDKEKTKKRT